jgi:hypothetical protein
MDNSGPRSQCRLDGQLYRATDKLDPAGSSIVTAITQYTSHILPAPMGARTSYGPSLSTAWRDMGFNKFIAARKGISAKAVTPMDVEPPNRKLRLVEASQKSGSRKFANLTAQARRYAVFAPLLSYCTPATSNKGR